jgi:hypothetical protein
LGVELDDHTASSSASSDIITQSQEEQEQEEFQVLIQQLSPNISYIAPNLYLGSITGACSQSYLRAIGITHTLTAASELLPSSELPIEHLPNDTGKNNDKIFCARDQLAALHVNIEDIPWDNLVDCLDTCLFYIDRVLALSNNGDTTSPPKLLVHCAYGVSRSASIILAWLMRTQYDQQHQQHHDTAPPPSAVTSYNTALTLLRTHRPRVRPNLGFAKQLKAWYASGCNKSTFLQIIDGTTAFEEENEDGKWSPVVNNNDIDPSWSLWSKVRQAGRIKITRNDVLRKSGLLEDLDWAVLESDPRRS